MKLYSDLKFFYRGLPLRRIGILITGGLFMLSLLKTIIKEISILVQDIIDPDINYDSIEDLIE